MLSEFLQSFNIFSSRTSSVIYFIQSIMRII